MKPGESLLGVRPGHIVLPQGGEKAITCKLEVNEMMGSELHLHTVTEDETRLIVRVPTLDLDPDARKTLVNGHSMNVIFEGKAMDFFNPGTENNLMV